MAIIYKITICLKKYRLQQGLSQQQLARITGLSQTYISDLELQIRNPSLKTFEVICNSLKVHPYILLEIKDTR